jgi:hypothetical protein
MLNGQCNAKTIGHPGRFKTRYCPHISGMQPGLRQADLVCAWAWRALQPARRPGMLVTVAHVESER